MRIAFTGIRGIPNRYGGFEQFAEFLAPALVSEGFEVTVYSPHYHPYREKEYKGVKLVHCYDPEPHVGAAGQFIYDLLCILDARKRGFDLIYQLGYTSSGIWQFLLPSSAVLVSNMDGMEWQRAKYSPAVRRFLRFSEKRVALRSDHLIADALPIKDYLEAHYPTSCTYIAYAAEPFNTPDPAMLPNLGVQPFGYYLLIARMQEDNHVEMIVQGYLASGSTQPLLLVGNTDNAFGRYLKAKYPHPGLRFLGGIFDAAWLDNLRYYAALYFHGHSAGGTNPSLLEAMAASARICAHDNAFNRSVCEAGALYFDSAGSIARHIPEAGKDERWAERITLNLQKIKTCYSKPKILDDYLQLFRSLKSKHD